MFEIFKDDSESTKDVKVTRDNILRFIKDELQRSEGGEGSNIKSIKIYSACTEEDRQVYESALYYEDQKRLKEEIQKIADDFALDLPVTWDLEIIFESTLPQEARILEQENIGLLVTTKQHLNLKSASALIRVLNGEAEQAEYNIQSGPAKVTIGREKSAQGADGFFRMNTIAFPGDSSNEANKYISRQHAHIEWNPESGRFVLFADDGGVPPQNKIKIKSLNTEASFKLNSTQIGHKLDDGDQIILGESAVLEFRYLNPEG